MQFIFFPNFVAVLVVAEGLVSAVGVRDSCDQTSPSNGVASYIDIVFISCWIAAGIGLGLDSVGPFADIGMRIVSVCRLRIRAEAIIVVRIPRGNCLSHKQAPGVTKMLV